jgi:hypothetical protein
MKHSSIVLAIGILVLGGCGPHVEQQRAGKDERTQNDGELKRTIQADDKQQADAQRPDQAKDKPEPKPQEPTQKEKKDDKKQVTQLEFVKLIESFSNRYDAAPNELKKAAVQADRSAAIRKALSGPKVTEWIGTLTEMKARGGDAQVTVELAGSDSISLTNEKNLFGEEILIPRGSKLFDKVADLAKGDTIVFSGKFVITAGDDNYIAEKGWTTRESMTKPVFVFQFTDISKSKKEAKDEPDRREKVSGTNGTS